MMNKETEKRKKKKNETETKQPKLLILIYFRGLGILYYFTCKTKQQKKERKFMVNSEIM